MRTATFNSSVKKIRSINLRRGSALVALAAPLVCAAGISNAAVTISGGKTRHMVCSAGVCSPTAAQAVLNVSDLGTLLAAGNLTISTTGSGVQASDIDFNSAFTGSAASTLTLDAYHSVTIAKTISIAGTGGLSLTTNDGGSGGTVSFGARGRVTFHNLSSQLMVDGTSFTLVASISALASAIAANPAGAYALAGSYNARRDRTYASSPVGTVFTGSFEGLGNTVSNLSISDTTANAEDGLFAQLGPDSTLPGAIVADLRMTNVNITGAYAVGALAGQTYNSSIRAISVSGTVTGTGAGGAYVGGLVGISEWTGNNGGSYGTIANSLDTASINFTGNAGGSLGGIVGVQGGAGALVTGSVATGAISGAGDASAGGLVGTLTGSALSNSYATGVVSASDGTIGGAVGVAGENSTVSGTFATGAVVDSAMTAGTVGGLVGGTFDTTIANSYALGSATAGNDSNVGGLVGDDYNGVFEYSYATGALAAGSFGVIGGVLGRESGPGPAATDVYWDTQTTGTSAAIGANGNSSGMTGLTTSQFQSGLPAGFSSTIWNETSNLNGGFPYLLANPPPS